MRANLVNLDNGFAGVIMTGHDSSYRWKLHAFVSLVIVEIMPTASATSGCAKALSV
jgi:hypothetical protein